MPGRILDKVFRFPLPCSFMKRRTKEVSFHNDRSFTCSEEKVLDKSWSLTKADSKGMIQKVVTDVPYLDYPVTQREQGKLVKLRASVVFSLAEGNVQPASNLELADQNQTNPLDAKETKKASAEVFTALPVQSDIHAIQSDTDKSISPVVLDLELNDEGTDNAADARAPYEKVEDAIYITPEVKGLCDPVQLQSNQNKSDLTQGALDSSLSELSPGNKYPDIRALGDCGIEQTPSECSSKSVSSFGFPDTRNSQGSWGGGLILEGLKISPEESKCTDIIAGQLNNFGASVHVAKAGGPNFSSQCMQDDSLSPSEKWQVDKDASECTSISFSGPIPNSGPLSFSGSFSFSGLATYSTQVPYSGSVSIRSESSTSTRSFAFPILNPEWSSSPVNVPQPTTFRRRQRTWRLWCYCVCCSKPSTLFD